MSQWESPEDTRAIVGWLSERYTYRQREGEFYHKQSRAPAGVFNQTSGMKYLAVPVQGRQRMFAVRNLVWILHHKGEWPDRRLVHHDGNKLNTCIDNLAMVAKGASSLRRVSDSVLAKRNTVQPKPRPVPNLVIPEPANPRRVKQPEQGSAALLAFMQAHFEYDALEGEFWRVPTWRAKHLRVGKGKVLVGTLQRGYKQASVNGEIFQVSQLVWLWETGAFPTVPLRFRNGDSMDTRFGNLIASA